MRLIFYTLLTFCIALSMTCCSPDEVVDKPTTNIPDQPNIPLVPDPELPDSPLTERLSCDFTATDKPIDYQAFNANNLEVVQPSQARVPMPMDPDDPAAIPDLRPFAFHRGYENSTVAGWHSYLLKNGTYAMTSYACDGNKDTAADNWLITDGIEIKSSKTLIHWKMCAAVDFDVPYPEFYEVYISTSPELNSFKTTGTLIYKSRTELDHMDNDKINKVDYLLEGYKGQTLYLAFRHTSPGAEKIAITLHKLTVSDFLLDGIDIEASQANCWWDCKPAKVTGVHYPIGAELTPEITILNRGFHLKNTSFWVSYTYNGKTVTEATPTIRELKQGKTYTYQFKEKIVYEGGSSFTTTVFPLPGEERLYANRCTLEGLTTIERPVMIRVLYEEGSGLDCSVCSKLFREFDKVDAAYPDRTIGVMYIDDRQAQRPYPAATGENYKHFIISKSRGWSAPPYAAVSRDKRYTAPNDIQPGVPPLALGNNLESPLRDYSSACYTPLEITATHRFSDDGKKMFVDVEVEALLDLEGLNYGIGGLVAEDNVQHKNYTMVNLGAPVFNHLVRGVLGDMKKGATGVIPATMKEGEKALHTFEYDIPEKYDVLTPNREQLYAVVMLIRPDESILTCNKTQKNAAIKAAYR